jgi:hypothetical protein
MDLEGQVMVLKNKTVKILLPSLGYMMQAEVETDNVKVISTNITQKNAFPNDRYAVN